MGGAHCGTVIIGLDCSFIEVEVTGHQVEVRIEDKPGDLTAASAHPAVRADLLCEEDLVGAGEMGRK